MGHCNLVCRMAIEIRLVGPPVPKRDHAGTIYLFCGSRETGRPAGQQHRGRVRHTRPRARLRPLINLALGNMLVYYSQPALANLLCITRFCLGVRRHFLSPSPPEPPLFCVSLWLHNPVFEHR